MEQQLKLHVLTRSGWMLGRREQAAGAQVDDGQGLLPDATRDAFDEVTPPVRGVPLGSRARASERKPRGRI